MQALEFSHAVLNKVDRQRKPAVIYILYKIASKRGARNEPGHHYNDIST